MAQNGHQPPPEQQQQLCLRPANGLMEQQEPQLDANGQLVHYNLVSMPVPVPPRRMAIARRRRPEPPAPKLAPLVQYAEPLEVMRERERNRVKGPMELMEEEMRNEWKEFMKGINARKAELRDQLEEIEEKEIDEKYYRKLAEKKARKKEEKEKRRAERMNNT